MGLFVLSRKMRLLLLTFVVSIVAHAQSNSSIYLTVCDKVSNRSLGSVRVSILTADSTLLDTCDCWCVDMPGNRRYRYGADVTSTSPYYLLKFERVGYKTRCVRVEAQKSIELNNVVLEREEKTRFLSEATVTASKVLMVMKGDTIVYNADAFELGEGSMLDQLISRLPGVSLEPGGVITVNGNKVSSLLINGKDFFKGNPTLALENLPAYTVNKIKAYQKAPNDAYLTRNSEKAKLSDPWVIDVNLKKDYNKGALVTAEGGAGTQNRYLGRLFAMRFTDRTNLFVYAKANNLNDQSNPGRDGNWADYAKNQNGRIKEQSGGVNFTLTGKNPENYINTCVEASHVMTDANNRTSVVNYYTTGDTYGRSRSHNRTEEKMGKWNSTLQLKAKKLYFSWEHRLMFSTTNNRTDLQSATFKYKPYEEKASAILDSLFYMNGYRQSVPMVNCFRNQGREETRVWNFGEQLYASFALFGQKNVNISLASNYNHISQTEFSQYLLQVPQNETQPVDFRNRYAQRPDKNYQLYGLLNCDLFKTEKNDWQNSLGLSYNIDYHHRVGGTTLYRLDVLNNGWNVSNNKPMGMLPSTTDSLTQSIDWANTFNSTNETLKNTLSLNYFMVRNGWQVIFQMPISLQRNQLDDVRNKPTEMNRVDKRYVWCEPFLQVSGRNLTFHFIMNQNLPAASLLLPIRDDTNPLLVWKGNAKLKPSTIYKFSCVWYKENAKREQSLTFSYNMEATRNAIGQTRTYNSVTGVTALMPNNMNGNWQTMGSVRFERAIDRAKCWSFVTYARTTYLHSVDFEQGMYAADDALLKSTVHNINTQGLVQLRFKSKPFNASLKVDVDWQHATSNRVDFTTLNSVNVLYGVTALAKLPWAVELNTDLTLYTRNGYADATMNKSEWIWNASVEKRFLKNKSLCFKCTAFDLLAQRRNVERRVNAQGYTETWYNTLPRYLLFTLSYRFHKSPKRAYN